MMPSALSLARCFSTALGVMPIAFRAVTHDSIADNYVITGTRGEERYIALNEEFIELGEWGKR